MPRSSNDKYEGMGLVPYPWRIPRSILNDLHGAMRGTLTLRAALPADESFLREVYASTREDELAPLPWDRAAKDAFLRMQFDAQRYHYHTHYPSADFQIILLDNQPIGRIYVARSQREVRLMDISLLPQFRNCGVGTRLLHDLLAEAQATSRPVTLHVEGYNPAMRLYERLGFQKIHDTGVYWYMEWHPAPEPGQ